MPVLAHELSNSGTSFELNYELVDLRSREGSFLRNMARLSWNQMAELGFDTFSLFNPFQVVAMERDRECLKTWVWVLVFLFIL